MKKSVIILKGFALLALVFMFAACGAGNGAPPGPATGSFNTSNLPYTESTGSGSFGTFAFDGDGNLLFVPNDYDQIWVMNRSTGDVSIVATAISGANDLLGMVYSGGYIYVGDASGYIYRVDPETGSSSSYTSVSGDVEGMAIAPAGFGSYGGMIIVATHSGYVYAIDQSLASPTPTLIVDIGTPASALVFGGDGTLYVAEYNNNTIVTVTSGGSVSVFATSGLSGPDGLTYDSTANVLYVANCGDDTLKSVTIPGGVVSTVGSYDFDGGYWPSPILYDSESNILFMGTGETGLTIDYLSL